MDKTGRPTVYDEVKKKHRIYFNIVKKRYWWFALSLLIIIPGMISFFMQGLNLGIDYKGGTMLDMTFNQAVTQSAISDTLASAGLGGSVQLSNGDTTALIRTEALDEGKRAELLTALEGQVGTFDKANLKEDLVGPAMGQELTRNAIYALLIAFGLMIVYITFRFRLDFAICGILGLVHDVLVVVGIFSLFQWEIDATFVAAILTIVGYSINDTIVIFDRIRENEPLMRRSDNYEDMVDQSIWQTMSRSINTTVTVLIALLALFILGGESTKMFSLAMIIGVFSGAYSTIFIVSQLYLEIRKRIKKNPRKSGKAVRV